MGCHVSNFCDPMDRSLPGSSVHGILQERILEWVAIPFSRRSFQLGIKPESPALAGRFFTTEPPAKSIKAYEGSSTSQYKCFLGFIDIFKGLCL